MPQGYDALFLEFVRRFNAGEFFESHEALEELWHRAGGELGRFYQGLIQLAVALEHLTRRNRVGAQRLLARAKGNLKAFLPRYHGIALETLLEEAEVCIREERTEGPFPRIVLEEG